MSVDTNLLLNKKVSEMDVFEFVKKEIAFNQDAKLEISGFGNEEYGEKYGYIPVLTSAEATHYRRIFFSESSGDAYKEINGGMPCLYLSLAFDDEAVELLKKIAKHFGGYLIENDCDDPEKEGYAVYYSENPKYSTVNHEYSLNNKLWKVLSTDPIYKPLLNNFGLIQKLLLENMDLTSKEFKEGDLVYHKGLKMFGKFEHWDIDDNTAGITFDDEGYEDYRRVSVSALKKLV